MKFLFPTLVYLYNIFSGYTSILVNIYVAYLLHLLFNIIENVKILVNMYVAYLLRLLYNIIGNVKILCNIGYFLSVFCADILIKNYTLAARLTILVLFLTNTHTQTHTQNHLHIHIYNQTHFKTLVYTHTDIQKIPMLFTRLSITIFSLQLSPK